MWRYRERLEAHGVDVLIVSFEPVARVRLFAEGVDHGWPILTDESRACYAAYGLSRTSWLRAWLSPRTLAHYLRAALVQRRLPRRPEADTLQLGGDIIIDTEGIIRFVHRSVEPADRPDVRTAVKELFG